MVNFDVDGLWSLATLVSSGLLHFSISIFETGFLIWIFDVVWLGTEMADFGITLVIWIFDVFWLGFGIAIAIFGITLFIWIFEVDGFAKKATWKN